MSERVGCCRRSVSRRRFGGGFTLVEALIAVTILGLMGSLVFGTFSHAVEAREKAERIAGHYHQVRQAMLRMVRELQMAFITLHRDRDDPRTETLFVAKRGSNGMRLDFTSFSHFKMHADANESDQNELSYFIDEHPDDPSRTALMRREQHRIDDEADEGGAIQVMAEDIKSLRFEFYNPDEDRWEDEWDTEDSDYQNRSGLPMLPVFVMIETKALDPITEKEETFVTKTRIFLRQPIRILGTGFAP